MSGHQPQVGKTFYPRFRGMAKAVGLTDSCIMFTNRDNQSFFEPQICF